MERDISDVSEYDKGFSSSACIFYAYPFHIYSNLQHTILIVSLFLGHTAKMKVLRWRHKCTSFFGRYLLHSTV